MAAEYTASSLSDVAELFERKAEECRKLARHSRPRKRASLMVEVDTWRRAADILRQTTLEPVVDYRRPEDFT